MGALDGLTILVPESRELDLFAGMLETHGAQALRCPRVQIADLDDPSEATSWIDAIIGVATDIDRTKARLNGTGYKGGRL